MLRRALPAAIAARLDEAIAGLAPRLDRTVEATRRDLAAANLLRDEPIAPLEVPPSFAEAIAGAMLLAERDGEPGGAERYALHYLELMPRLRVEQLATRAAPSATLFHAPLDWPALPRLSSVVDRLFALLDECGVDPAERRRAYGAEDASAFRRLHSTLASLYGATCFGGFMPLLYAYPTDLQRMGRALDAGIPVAQVIDRELAAPLAHELSHGPRRRRALSPPYLDECAAGWVGTQLLDELAWPAPGESNAIYAAPWFAQVGQALARAFGRSAIVRAQLGLADAALSVGEGASIALARLGLADHLTHRAVHFLGSNWRPAPWLKAIFLAAAGRALPDGERALAELAALAWSDVPLPADDDTLDGEMLRDALRAACVRNFQIDRCFRVERRAPDEPIDVDLARCLLRAAPGRDGHDPHGREHLFPPTVAAALRARGVAGLEVRLARCDDDTLAAVATAIRAGRNGGGPGWSVAPRAPRPV